MSSKRTQQNTQNTQAPKVTADEPKLETTQPAVAETTEAPEETVEPTAVTETPVPTEEPAAEAPKATPSAAGPNPVLVETIEQYIASMNPTRLIDQNRDGVVQQRKFANAVVGALGEANRALFQSNMRFLLETIQDDETGVFNETHVFRFYDHVSWTDPAARREAEALITLLINVADEKTRAKNARLLMGGEFMSRLTARRGEQIAANLRRFFDIKS